MGISLFFFLSCSKKDGINDNSDGRVRIEVNLNVSDFSNSINQKKLASNYSYEPSQIYSVDYNKDFILLAELRPLSYDLHDNVVGSKLLTSNINKRAATRVIDNGDVYRIMVFKSNGDFEASKDYTRGTEESDTDPLSLNRNTSYTFICYSLNSTRLDSLDFMLNTLSQGVTRTLGNTSITLDGNQDLLFYKAVKTTSNNAVDNLGIILNHQFNLLRTTIDVSLSGYSMAQTVTADLVSKSNRIILGFDKPQTSQNNNDFSISRTSLNNQQPLTFTYSTAPNTSLINSLATSNYEILNVGAGESILNIKTLSINNISNVGGIFPFINGVTLDAGGQYNLSVKMVPKDSLYIYEGVPVARINGDVWMRYNLGAPGAISDANGSQADVLSDNLLGGYYQWGSNIAALAGDVPNNQIKNYPNNFQPTALTNLRPLSIWNATTGGVIVKGNADPCPNNFRIPTVDEYNNLISATTSSYPGTQKTTNTSDVYSNYALRLTSKRKKDVILTIPAQGYAGIGSGTANYNGYSFTNFSNRGEYVYLKTRTVNESKTETPTGSNIPSNVTEVIAFKYTLLQGKGGTPSIFNGPIVVANAYAYAHPVRCIAIGKNSRILLNDRTENQDNTNVTFND